MAINKSIRLNVALILALAWFLYEVKGRPGGLRKSHAEVDVVVFDVTKCGAKGNGKPVYDEAGESMNGMGFIGAWNRACHNKGASKVLIPKGKYVVAQLLFLGPCESHVTFELQGNVVADPDVSQFPNNELFLFQQVDGVTFTGPGTIDVYRQPHKPLVPNRDIDFFNLMPSIKFLNVTNGVIDGITSTNPSAFHVLVAESRNIIIRNVKFDAAFLAPNSNSDGVYITASSLVTVTNSFIRTADDCVTIAPGSTDVSIIGVTCSSGKGISIGEEPYTHALDIKGVIVKNCTFKDSAFGARIFTRPRATPSQISSITFEDLVMEAVQSPIVITQQFQHKLDKSIQPKIIDVHFGNIKGTTTSNNIISFSCDPLSPCERVEVTDIDICINGTFGKTLDLLATCLNTKVFFGGKHDGLNCSIP